MGSSSIPGLQEGPEKQLAEDSSAAAEPGPMGRKGCERRSFKTLEGGCGREDVRAGSNPTKRKQELTSFLS